MGTQGNEICPVLLRVQRNFQKGLHRIGVQQRPALSGFELAGDLRDGIYVSRFIVYSHDGYQCRVLPQGRLHLVSGDAPGVVGLEIRYLIPLLGQGLARFQYGAVFHGGGDDMPPGVTSDMQRCADGPVITLGAAGSEIQCSGVAAQGLGDNSALGGHGIPRFPAQRILGGRVAESPGQRMDHRFGRFWRHRRGSGIIKIIHGKKNAPILKL